MFDENAFYEGGMALGEILFHQSFTSGLQIGNISFSECLVQAPLVQVNISG